MSNLKNLSNVNFPELRKKYEKFKVTFLLEQSDKVKINFIEFDNRICYLILTEILYNAGYINKKICVFDNEENCQNAANMIIDSILNYNAPHKVKLRNSIRNYIIKRFNWTIIGKNMLKEMNI